VDTSPTVQCFTVNHGLLSEVFFMFASYNCIIMKPIVLVLAGGKGVRMAPFLTNKTMWPFLGDPLIVHVLRAISEGGFDEVLVVSSSNNDSFVRSLSIKNLKIHTVIQDDARGMDDAVLQAEPLIGKRSMIVVNGVDLVHPSLFAKVKHKIEAEDPPLLVCGMQTSALLPMGYYRLKGDRVVETIEKPNAATKPSNIVRLTLDYFKKGDEFFQALASVSQQNNAQTDARYEAAQSLLLAQNPATLILYDGYWQKLKYPHYVLDITKLLLTHCVRRSIAPSANISPRACVEGDVIIGENAVIEAGAIVKGPCYIGKHVVVGTNSLVRQSIIEEHSVVGFASEVARSYVGPRCNLHHSFVGDSVLEKEVNMSWGTVTANLRFDKKTVRLKLPPHQEILDTGRDKLGALIAQGAFLGVNVSTMPGTVISAYTTILPHTKHS
jgi:bifunctional UDP-N-acetylglucosamine pyrophosphorylase/glucosamine-1-phosphate N-acetyltransferase